MPFPSPGDLLGSGIEPTSSALAGRFFTSEPAGKSGGGAEELAQKLSDLPEPKAGLGREGMGERGWGWASRRVRAARELHAPRALCVAGTVQSLIQPICLNLYL